MSKTGVVIVAAGKGTRMGTKDSKQYLPLADKPVLIHALHTFAAHPDIDAITVVVPPGDEERVRQLAATHNCAKLHAVTAGGVERQQSVRQGLIELRGIVEYVLVHDGVRPFATHSLISAVLEAARTAGSAIAAVPVKDTIKIAGTDGCVAATPDRHSLWAVQTPQAFRLSLLLEAYEQAEQDGFLGTDDATLIERLGQPVKIVHGEYANIKITTIEDLQWAEQYAAALGQPDDAARER